jgi:hypothetical protein
VVLAVFLPSPTHTTYAVVDKGDVARMERRRRERYFIAAHTAVDDYTRMKQGKGDFRTEIDIEFAFRYPYSILKNGG